MKFIRMIFLLTGATACLLGCSSKVPTTEEYYTLVCKNQGYKDKALADCVSSEVAGYNKYKAEEQRKAQTALAEEQKKAMASFQKIMAEQHKTLADTDKATCRGYGFKSGTEKFAACMQREKVGRKQAEASAAQSELRASVERERANKLAELKEVAGTCNLSRSIDSGYNSEADQLRRFASSDACTKAQLLAVELGLDPAKVINPIPVARQPARITCNTFGDTTTCNGW